MSSIGKVFVVVNLVLALLVLGAAGALLKRTEATKQQVEERDTQISDLQQQLDDANSQFAERERLLNAEKQRLQEDNDDISVQRTNAINNATSLQTTNQQLLDDITKINSRIDSLETSYTGAIQRNTELADQMEQFRTESLDAQESARQAQQDQRAAEDDLAAAQRELGNLQGQLLALQASNDEAGKLLEVAKAAGFQPTTLLAMPRIEAVVAEVDDEYGFVILDKGTNDAVERGFTFDIHRSGSFMGRVVVDEVYANYATARIDILAPNQRMQRHDRASTYLN